MTDVAIESAPALLDGDLSSDIADALRAAGRIAWDIETSGLDWRAERIGTCQLHAPQVGTVVVQLNGHTPTRLPQLLANPEVLKVFHHAPFDLRFMVWHWSVLPQSVACTKVASKLIAPQAPNESHSLQKLLEQHLGVNISKAERTSDWLASALTSSQLSYAASDVTHLLPLLDSLEKDLANKGLSELYARCVEFLPARVQLETGDYPDVFAY
jgi:ribonuclease D